MSKREVVFFSILISFVLISVSPAFNLLSNEKIYNDTNYTSVSTQQRQLANDHITGSRNNLITETVKKVSPAVVGINVTETRTYRDPWANDPFWRQFFGDQTYNQQIKMLGSGTIISPDGYILTNDHVAGNADKIVVTLTNGNHFNAKVVGNDPVSDICLLKIDGENLPSIKMGNSEDVMTGEWVIALGNPFGLFEINDQPTVTVGVISAKGMNLDPVDNRYYLGMLQTDASINSGNSGGPLVNSVGELIGMNTLIYTGGGAGSIGLGFAIPIDKIKKIIEDIKKHGTIDRNFWIGMSAQTIDEGIAKYYKLASTRGVIVTNVEKNSPAFKAGIEVGDIISEIDNYKVNNYQSLIGVFQEFRTGESINLKIMRDNNPLTKKMTLERKYD
ncbi:MAG: trypsin-like peptidase domain-containing protein [Ignavibacteriales bacterium]|nr:trypsin-like peptidase domain-containing protein [Ignavibacteriales bacterium]